MYRQVDHLAATAGMISIDAVEQILRDRHTVCQNKLWNQEREMFWKLTILGVDIDDKKKTWRYSIPEHCVDLCDACRTSCVHIVSTSLCATCGCHSLYTNDGQEIRENHKCSWRTCPSRKGDIGSEDMHGGFNPSKRHLCKFGLDVRKEKVFIWGTATAIHVCESPFENLISREINFPRSENCLHDNLDTGSLQNMLWSFGFTLSPNSVELVLQARQLPDETFIALRQSIAGRQPDLHAEEVVRICIKQIKQVIPHGCAVVGLYKSLHRLDFTDSSSKLHKDDVHITADDVRRALFPMTLDANGIDLQVFDRYLDFCEDMHALYANLQLPSSMCTLESVLRTGDLNDLAQRVIAEIHRYNEGLSEENALVFDNVNVWIPRDVKQLIFLPLQYSRDIPYPAHRWVVDKMQIELRHSLVYSPEGSVVIFFGQSVLHQALVGPEASLGSGSLEGRYLTLVPRKYALHGTLRVNIDKVGEECYANSLSF